MREQFDTALKEAMRAQDTITISTLRLILAALKDRDIAARTKGKAQGVEDDDILQMLQTMVKQRQESIALYEQGGRLELAEREQAEIDVIRRFLPKQMSEAEISEAVIAAIDEIGAVSLKDMGAVMSVLRGRYAGQMNFGKASTLAKERLS